MPVISLLHCFVRKNISKEMQPISFFVPVTFPFIRAAASFWQALPATRGVLCAMRRPAPRTPEEVCRDARRVAVIHGVVDTTNIGAIFRSAAALGIDAILLSPDSCDPLNRRAVRVSMGSVFLVPWTWLPRPVSSLREMGFCTASLALTDRSVPIDYPELKEIPRLAIVMGTEGDGLPAEVLSESDYVVRIPMWHGVDSLNVAAASAVAFWELRARR